MKIIIMEVYNIINIMWYFDFQKAMEEPIVNDEKDYSAESFGADVSVDSTLKEKKDFNKGTAQGVSLELCPYCGGVFKKSKNQGGYEKHKCTNCGYEIYLENEKGVEKLFALNSFRNEVINLLHACHFG